MSLVDDRSKPLTPAGIHAIAQGPDGWIAAGDGRCHAVLHKDGELRYHFDFSTENHRMRAHERIRGMGFNGDGTVFFVAASDTIYGISLETGSVLWQYTPPRSFGFLVITPTALDVRGDRVAVSFDNGTIGVWSSNGELQALWHDDASPRWLRWLDDQRLIGSDTFLVAIWQIDPPRRVRHWRLSERAYGFDLEGDCKRFALRTLHSLHIHNVDDFSTEAVQPVGFGLPLIALSPHGDRIAVGERHGVAVRSADGEEIAYFGVGEAIVTGLRFGLDGSQILVAAGPREIETFRLPA